MAAIGTDDVFTGKSEAESEAVRRLYRVLGGRLNQDGDDPLPVLQSKVVRVFTSSTFTGRL